MKKKQILERLARGWREKRENLLWIVPFSCFILIITIYQLGRRRPENFNNYINLGKVSKKINEIWKRGDYQALKEQGINCEKEFGNLFNLIKSNLYFRCNPSFLNCYLRNYKKIVKKSSITFQQFPIPNFREKKSFYQIISRANYISEELPPFSIKVKAQSTLRSKKSIEFFLEDSCNDAYLPQRIYAIGPFNSEDIANDWKWDNFDQDIFIDKNYVTFRDILDWIEYDFFLKDESLKRLIPQDKTKLSGPARGLSMTQMKRYCHFRGKELLHSRVLDGASFHPVSMQKKRRNIIYRGPFPWSYNKKGEEISDYMEDQSLDFKNKYCSKILANECLKKSKLIYPLESGATWIGIYNALGTWAEVVNNKLNPAENIHPSSMLFSLKSKVHQIGIRGRWDQKEYDSTNFKIPHVLEPFDRMNLAFRCMATIN